MIEVGLTKEGESLAAGSTSTERPKCIVTGGAATMTLSYQGRTFPICCTGCRDEFNENPEKYIKKASLLLGSEAGKSKTGQPAPSRVSRFEDAFAGDVVDAKDDASPASKGPKSPSALPKPSGKPEASPDATSFDSKRQTTPAAETDAARIAVSKRAARAATLLRAGAKPREVGQDSGRADLLTGRSSRTFLPRRLPRPPPSGSRHSAANE